jgi:proton-dependent oligopeptide transporter, POT family
MTKNFFSLLAIQYFFQSALWIVIILLPIYVGQNEVEGGLAWGHVAKGILLFVWALSQNLTSILSGPLLDRRNRKSSLILAHLLLCTGYFVLGVSEEFYLFLFGVILLGIGSGIFKPNLEGWIAGELDRKNHERRAKGWGYFIFVINLAVLIATFFADFLKSISWSWAFFGPSLIMLSGFAFIKILDKNKSEEKSTKSIKTCNTFGELLSNFRKPEIKWLVIIMSGFTMIYMQFYETLPNFIYDWTNSESLAILLPEFMQEHLPRGTHINYLYIFLLNPILVILLINFVSHISSKFNRIRVLQVGMILVSLGCLLAGVTNAIYLLLIGFVFYTIGEMITRTKLNEIFGTIAPSRQKSTFISLMYMSYAFGYSVSALGGGWLYEHFGDRSNLALEYYQSNFGRFTGENILVSLAEKLSLSPSGLNQFLWETYHPWLVWIPFVVIGLLSVIGLGIYFKKYSN